MSTLIPIGCLLTILVLTLRSILAMFDIWSSFSLRDKFTIGEKHVLTLEALDSKKGFCLTSNWLL